MNKLLLVLMSLMLASCVSTEQKNDAAEMNGRFDGYKTRFIENLWKVYPGWASSVGYHAYDSVLVIPGDRHRKLEVDFSSANLDSLRAFDPARLSDNNKTDYAMIQNLLASTVWSTDTLKSYEWDPSEYNVSRGFAEILNGEYDSLPNRLHSFYLKMKNIPAYYEAAKKNIANPTREHTQLAIEQNLGGIAVFETDLREALKKDNPKKEIRDAILERAASSVKAIRDFADWLKHLKNPTPRSFRLGKDLYARKFEYDIQSGYTADQIYAKAVAHKNELHRHMFELADRLWPKYMAAAPKPADSLVLIKQVIDKISLVHVSADSFQSAIERQIPVLAQFVNDKHLVKLDPSKPLVVRKEPAYMAGVAGASVSAPGPYDKNGKTYYNVGSLAGWEKAKAESYLREYNAYTLQILNIHEAIPGHYTQLVYSNQSPSLIKSLLGNSAMIEGWAVYAERMMLENGYGNNTDEMWLMYDKWNLRSTINTILDYSVHAGAMSQAEAMDLLTREAFQQQSEAEGKWRRVSLTQVQLCCYFTGFTEICDLRDALRKKEGERFNLKQFHEQFLGYGSAPVKYIAALMLR